ncbi:circularly permuted type 2 ATP-grasp protein [Georgenia sp. Z1491]|uniref:circularly permuted type 2 ATP-grasp protein n=1 Tax=Georgenia sp. Z1491 TaxID=3416707 RepID=UPI003CF2D4DD
MSDLVDDYRARATAHDEMLGSHPDHRRAWTKILTRPFGADPAALTAVADEVVDLLQDQSVTYGEPDSTDGWNLDPVPVLVDDDGWQPLESGLAQRAHLLDLVLDDIYGERRLLTSGAIPPEVVLAHPRYSRHALGLPLHGEHRLFHLAVDVARNADRTWTVLMDRTGTPAGAGYAMADRRVVSEVLSGVYRRSRVRRVGPYFQTLLRSLQEAAPAGAGDEPHVAVLSPGPEHPTYFDQAYLAGMLGLQLVHGSDLRVDGGRLTMRSLGSEEQVDVLLRHVPAADVDPLEIRSSAGAGTPGLLHALRSGSVAVLNPIGSGVLESPAVRAHLPRAARYLGLGDLELPTAVTYWCGDRSMCNHVIANLHRLVVRPVAGPERAVRGWELTVAERAALAARISQRPGWWVGEEPVDASTTPTVDAGTLNPRATSLRLFAVVDGADYQVMSGAVGTSAADDRSTPLGGSLDGRAKDVWVITHRPQPVTASGAAGLDALPGRFPDTAVSPRAAEDLFWLGRYTERAEATVRMLAVATDRWDDFRSRPDDEPGTAIGPDEADAQDETTNHDEPAGPGGSGHDALDVLVRALGLTPDDPAFGALVTDRSLAGSVAWCVQRIQRDARGVRDNLPPEVLTVIASLERVIGRERRRATDELTGVQSTLSRLLESLMALHGIFTESLVRDIGWRLLDVGRRLERAQGVVRALEPFSRRRAAGAEELVLESVLTAHDSVITFRRRYPAGGLGAALELLLLDEANPRALAFQVAALQQHLEQLPALARTTGQRDELLAQVRELLAELRTERAEEVRDDGTRTHLEEILTSISWRLRELTGEITAVHFRRTPASRWTEGRWEQ